MNVLPVTENDWSVDVEGDLIPSTRVWCLCAVNIKTQEEKVCLSHEEIVAFVKTVQDAGGRFIGHNFIGYDAPTLNRITGSRIRLSDISDTLVLSQIYKPQLEGGHSIEAWGNRLKIYKQGFDDFSKFSQELVDRCLQDARITRKVYLLLRQKLLMAKFSVESLWLEHEAWELLKRQNKSGFGFDIQGAHILLAQLRQIEAEIVEEVEKTFPPVVQCIATYKRPFKKDGSETENFKRHKQEYDSIEIDTETDVYNCFGEVRFNLGSPDQRVEKLLELGWKPREFTKGGKDGKNKKPKPTDSGRLAPSLQEFVDKSGDKAPGLIAKWIEINARGNAIDNWIDTYNPETGCIHGTLWLAGTLRYRHSGPNTANIPAVRKDENGNPVLGIDGRFTYEARALWRSRDPANRVMVGVDAKGIQLRILANRINNDRFTKNILSEDPHAANRDDFGMPPGPQGRRLAKTVTYATLMGAGDGKVATEAQVSLEEAKRVKKVFFDKVPELPRLIARLKAELQATGRITLCDGSRVLVSSDHMVIPYLLQGDESKIMKKAMVLIDRECRRQKIDAIQVGMIHDELQFDVHRKDIEVFRGICLAAFLRAGEYFRYNLPTDGDVSIGDSWAATH